MHAVPSGRRASPSRRRAQPFGRCTLCSVHPALALVPCATSGVASASCPAGAAPCLPHTTMPSERIASPSVDARKHRGVSAPCVEASARSPVGFARRPIAVAPSPLCRGSVVRPCCAVARWCRAVIRRRSAMPRGNPCVILDWCAVARPYCAERPKVRAPAPWRRAWRSGRRERCLVRHAPRRWPIAERRGLRSRLHLPRAGHPAPPDVADRRGWAVGPGRRIGAVNSTRDHTPLYLTPRPPPACQGGWRADLPYLKLLFGDRVPEVGQVLVVV